MGRRSLTSRLERAVSCRPSAWWLPGRAFSQHWYPAALLWLPLLQGWPGTFCVYKWGGGGGPTAASREELRRGAPAACSSTSSAAPPRALAAGD